MTATPPPLILASASSHRANLLKNAGLEFDVQSAAIDERAVELPLQQSQMPVDDIALVLAEAKARAVVEAFGVDGRSFVLGCDQTLALEGKQLHKPADMEAARRQLLAMVGKTHQIHSAVALVRGNETVWRYISTAHLSMRHLTPGQVGHYLARAGDAVLGSVGAYQVESLGISLFDRIEGDFFTIVGLPLLPLLRELRKWGIGDEF